MGAQAVGEGVDAQHHERLHREGELRIGLGRQIAGGKLSEGEHEASHGDKGQKHERGGEPLGIQALAQVGERDGDEAGGRRVQGDAHEA